MLIACLTWITDENYERRIEKATQSLRSLSPLSHNVVIINNGGNEWADRISRELRFNYKRLSKNYYDVAVHYSAYELAKKFGQKYFCYTYDDFVLYDHEALLDAEDWLNKNRDVINMRVPKYVAGSKLFDTAYTSKSVNCEAVRHIDGAGGDPLLFGNEETCGTHRFMRANWRPNSRPMIWKTSAFSEYALISETCPVMQPFEKHMYDVADRSSLTQRYRSSLLNGGSFSTFPQETSDRMLQPDLCVSKTVNTIELIKELW